MLDIKFIRENKEVIAKAAKDKGVRLDLDKLLNVDEGRRALQQKVDDYREEKNKVSAQIATEKDKSAKQKLIKEMQSGKEKGKKLENEFQKVEKEFRELALLVPNIPSEDTPVGPDESANAVIEKFGSVPKFAFETKDHVQLGIDLNLLDFDRGAKVAGSRGYFLKNELALLHWALLWHAFNKMKDKGFEVMVPPATVKELALIGSGHFPGERQEIYELEDHAEEGKELKYLSGTSEPSLLSYRADEIINEKELPLKYSGLSACYRREVGGYGKDTKGLYRVHEFSKVEQVIICKNDLEESLKLFEELKQNALEILEELELPHRVIQISTGDMGAGKYKMYDIETWMPSRDSYGETHSNSHLTDWQARRLNMRYKTKSGELVYPHTMNNTAIASPRILIALMENHQQSDGSIKIPKALHKYLDFKKIG